MQKTLNQREKASKLDQLIDRMNEKLNRMTYYETKFADLINGLSNLNDDIKEIKSDISFIKRQVMREESVN